jgi:chorismate dehydratase
MMQTMHLAVWNYAPSDFILSGFTSGSVPSPFEIVRQEPARCADMLRENTVDVAMLPTVEVLRDPEAFDVVPAVALSTWRYPFARLILRDGLERPATTVVYDPQYEQEHQVARLILEEHYRMSPHFEARPGLGPAQLLEESADGSLIVGGEVATLQLEGLVLDLGQEWFELANYPMVWALFATLKGRMLPEIILGIRDSARAAEAQRRLWIRAQETSASLYEFYREDLRVRLDDVAIASLTELRHYLFFHEALGEMPEIPFVFLPDDAEEDEGEGGRFRI